MLPNKTLTITINPKHTPKAYPRIIFEMVNGTNFKLLDNYSEEQLDEFVKAVFQELKPYLN